MRNIGFGNRKKSFLILLSALLIMGSLIFIVLTYRLFSSSQPSNTIITLLPPNEWSLPGTTLTADGTDTVEEIKFYGPFAITHVHRR